MTSAVKHVLWAIVIAMALTPGIVVTGPWLEARLFPVAQIEAVDWSVAELPPRADGQRHLRLSFRTATEKWRPCLLELFIFNWVFDSSVEVSPVFIAGTSEVFHPQSVMVTGKRTSRELYTDIPPVVLGFKEVRFAGTAFFRCHPFWPLPAEMSLTVKIPSATATPVVTP